MSSNDKDDSSDGKLRIMKNATVDESLMLSHVANSISPGMEEILFEDSERQAYEATRSILMNEQMTFFAPLPSVVSIQDVTRLFIKKKYRSDHTSRLGGDDSGSNTTSSTSHARLRIPSNDDRMNSTMAVQTPDPRFGARTDDIAFDEILDGNPRVTETGTSTTHSQAPISTSLELENSVTSAAGAMTETYPYHRAYHHSSTHHAISEIVTLATPSRGHHELSRALEKLEGLEKEELSLVTKTSLTRQLTELVTGDGMVHRDSSDAVRNLELLGKAVPRRVCQHPFKKNDIVWVCRTCQADETCVLCHACFSQSNHEGHDVAFYHAQAGGCCDCGDPDAWDPSGFCPYHGPNAIPAAGEVANNVTKLAPSLVHRVRGVVPSCADWLVREVATNSEIAFRRANPPKPRKNKSKSSKSNFQAPTADASGEASTIPRSRSMTVDFMDVDVDNDNNDEEAHESIGDSSDDLSLDNFPTNNPYLNEDHPLFAAASPPAAVSPVTASNNHDHLAFVFSPEAASLTRRFADGSSFDNGTSGNNSAGASSEEQENRSTIHLAKNQNETNKNERAKQLGLAGYAGRGLFLVLHADDIHSTTELTDALRDFLGNSSYYTDTLLNKFVKALRQYGQLVIWGTMEIMSEVGPTQVQLWMDGDEVASTRIGAVLSERARRLCRLGLFCSILTRNELILEQRAVAVLQWLSCLARSCDPLCLTVAESILPNRHLVPLLRADFKMSARVTKAWYSLLLTLLAVPAFKSHLAAAYCDTYQSVTAKYARGMGVLERSGYTLSVQFLNRVTYVIDLVQKRDLLGKLGKSLLETFRVACRNQNLSGRLNPNHFVLTHRRYSPCVSDLKCVLNVKGMPRIVACRGGTFLQDWIDALSVAQFMDSQVWRHWSQQHVEDENRGWVGAFNASISLGSLFERLLGWEDDEVSPIQDQSSPLSHDLMSCVELTLFILTRGIDRWQRTEALFYEATAFRSALEPHKLSPASLPFSTLAAKHGTALAMRQLPISQMTSFSFHLPLHRFVAGCLRELCLRRNSNEGGIGDLLKRLRATMNEEQEDDLFRGMMEFTVLVQSRAAQVRAALWRRNGHGLSDQVLNYAEPPFCRNMRDADLMLSQFATLGRTRNQSASKSHASSGMAFLSNLLLHRLGIFDSSGMQKAPNANVTQYLHEISIRLYPKEHTLHDSEDEECPLPWTYTPVRESSTSMLLLEEFLHFVIIFITELPPLVPNNREEHTKQAQFRLFREVVHRLASGPKTHSELSEVHHVLSHWDNVLLSEEGKLVNPDDATGAALGTVLGNVADRKVSRGKMEPDKWEMRESAWQFYDPAFYHISLRCHQTAAELRPKPLSDPKLPFGWKARPYAPEPTLAHPFFQRLRRDATADMAVLALTYKVLHMHCRKSDHKSKTYVAKREKSETSLARSIHIITLGAFAWKDAKNENSNWREEGGGSPGSLFFDRSDDFGAPDAGCWVSSFLLANPSCFFDDDEYNGEENALLLLQRLAVDGGVSDVFVAQDSTMRAGAAWLCEFALCHCSQARSVLSVLRCATPEAVADAKKESDIDRRKKMAKEAAMAKMKAQALKFASMMDMDLGETEDVALEGKELVANKNQPVRKFSFGSTHSSSSSAITRDTEAGSPPKELSIVQGCEEVTNVASRLLQRLPKCIICNYEDSSEGRFPERGEDDDGEGQRKKSKKRTENALGFVGYAQASTVMKGGGGPPPDLDSPLSPVCEFVGTHVALCGHAVHSECCESYLATVSHREDRAIGKRDEFRCPLCQRLSNCLVPFIDVGIDWIDCQQSFQGSENGLSANSKMGDDMMVDSQTLQVLRPTPLQNFLESTPWWVSRHNMNVAWDGQSAFLEKGPTTGTGFERDDPAHRKSSNRIRSLKKKDLYAAWNAMMRTPRLNVVRRSLRRSSSMSSFPGKEGKEAPPSTLSSGEDSTGETVVWKRLIDQISDISYRADSKRLGDSHLHDLFGEFRHYIVEKYAYNMTNQNAGTEPTDWPSCLFPEPINEPRRQELSREKLLSKLLLSIQSFSYSCSCEFFEARRSYRRALSISSKTAKAGHDSSIESIISRFGISNVACDGRMIVMPIPSQQEDSGSWPFDGRLGKLRYFGLTIMAAAAAVAADLVHLTMSFPLPEIADTGTADFDHPVRAPIAYPILFGHVLTHVVAAMCATCGRARARNDSLEVVWPVPFSSHGSFSSPPNTDNRIDAVAEDCEGFLKLGLLARILQILLGSWKVNACGCSNAREFIGGLQSLCVPCESLSSAELRWTKSCVRLLEIALSKGNKASSDKSQPSAIPSLEAFREACNTAAVGACSFLCESGSIFQVLVPGSVSRFHGKVTQTSEVVTEECSIHRTYEQIQEFLNLEPIDDMLESDLVHEIVSNWYNTACLHSVDAVHGAGREGTPSLKNRLLRTQGFRVLDWPSAGIFDKPDDKLYSSIRVKQESDKVVCVEQQPQDDVSLSRMHIESISNPVGFNSNMDPIRPECSSLLAFSSKKCVPLVGGYTPDISDNKVDLRPRVLGMPTSYTDLYAELCSLLPDCEQIAVCLICGEVLNAAGKGECTRHSYKCGAGAGMFFLLQECSGLIMHKSKAAYVHSPYVDSHGETPQYRGRPLNLDVDRYELLREVWFTHGVRQKVVAERGSSRQVIIPEFY